MPLFVLPAVDVQVEELPQPPEVLIPGFLE